MKKFDVLITETTIRTCKTAFDAIDDQHAEDLAREAYENGDFSDDFNIDMDDGGVVIDVEEVENG